jgi:hypothetical protein
MIEQAIFTSAETCRLRGYQLVAASPGIDAQIARELTTWSPSHESLCDGGDAAASVNFHPVGGERWCISQSVAAGEEYSGRGGTRVYTQAFVVGQEDLGRFANSPFALLRTVRGCGLLNVQDPIPPHLTPLALPGQSAPVDEGLLAQFVEQHGPARVAWLVDAALASDRLLVIGAENRDLLAAGLINCLPAECRPEISLATGLVYSPRRPFKVNVLSLDAVDARRLSRQSGITVLNIADEPPADFIPSGWAAYLFEAMAVDGLPIVCAEFERSRNGLRLSDLGWLADQLTERLHSSHDEQAMPPSVETRLANGQLCRAHSAHERFAGTTQTLSPEVDAAGSVATRTALPELATLPRETLDRLEQLDDLVFDTIGGRRPALEELTAIWPKLCAELPADVLAESREQYLNYAMKLWETCAGEDERDATWAAAALDVLCVLFNDG